MISSLAQAVLVELERGPTTRKHLRELAERSDREVRGAVSELRLAGHLVIVDNAAGYRLACNAGEVSAYVGSLVRRVGAMRETIIAMECAAARVFGGGSNGK